MGLGIEDRVRISSVADRVSEQAADPQLLRQATSRHPRSRQ